MANRNRFRFPPVIALAALFAQPAVSAEPAAAAPPLPVPKNLQVFPKDIKVEELLANMYGFITALGVGCDHCHAPAKLPPGKTAVPGQEELDFSLDDKPAKRTARQMLVMLRSINAMIPAAVGKPAEQAIHIQCANCHRGMTPPPLALGDLLDKATAEKGRDAAIAQYRALRAKYYGAQLYDFSDGELPTSNVATTYRLGGLPDYALRLARAGRPDDALAWLKVNLEYFPKSALSWSLMSFAYQAKNDRAATIKVLEKSVELAPRSQFLKDNLAQARAAPPPAPAPTSPAKK